MSQSGTSPTPADYLYASDWAYAQAFTNYVDADATLPAGFSTFDVNGKPLFAYDETTGFYGAALITPSGQILITFEGTNFYTGNIAFTAAQTADDLNIAAGQNAASYATAYNFTQTVIADAIAAKYSTSDIFLTGHSLGAADVEYVAAQTGLAGATFGAPGIPLSSIPWDAQARITNYVERGDPVGNYALGGNDFALLQSPGIVHFGTTTYIGSYYGTALLLSADATYVTALHQTTYVDYAAGIAATLALLGEAAKEYHVLSTYATDLGIPIPLQDNSANAVAGAAAALIQRETPSSSSQPGSSLGATGAADLPGFDVTAPGAVSVSHGTITLTVGGQSASLTTPGSSDTTFSLSSDGQGGTMVIAGAAPDGYVFGGSDGAIIQGDTKPLTFVGGTGSVSIVGGSGATSLFGATGSNSTSFLMGGSATNVIYGGAGATGLIAGTGASTLVGGTGSTVMLANGAASDMMVAGSGTTIINGTTGTGPHTIFAGAGSDVIALGAGSDTMIGGSGVASVVGGTGPDVYGFIDGHAGGNVIIQGLQSGDNFAFAGYSGNPIAAEGVLNGSDLITLTDGTNILLQSIDHKIFS